MADKKIGSVSHFFDKISVAVVDLTAPLKKGDLVKFKKGDDQFEQTIVSMQVDRKDIEKAKKGDDVAIKVDKPVKTGTEIFLVT